MKRIPENLKLEMIRRYGSAPVSLQFYPIYSTVRFLATIAGVIDTTTRKAFSYGQGQAPTAAGFAAAFGNATKAETNLKVGNQTPDNKDVLIYGLTAHLTPESEPMLARRVWRETALELAVGGNTTFDLGRLEMIPGGGGLRGVGQSAIKVPSLGDEGMVDGGRGASVGFVENGLSHHDNYFELDAPIFWSGVQGGSDASFNILCTPQRTINETVHAARVAAAGTTGVFTPPAASGDLGTFVDVVFALRVITVTKQSKNG